MTAVLYDEVVTAAPARKLTVVRDFETARITTRAPAFSSVLYTLAPLGPTNRV